MTVAFSPVEVNSVESTVVPASMGQVAAAGAGVLAVSAGFWALALTAASRPRDTSIGIRISRLPAMELIWK